VEPSTTSDVVDAFYSKITVVDQMQNDDKVAFDVVDLGVLKPYSGAFDRTAFFRGEITTVREFVRYFFFPSCLLLLLLFVFFFFVFFFEFCPALRSHREALSFD
jgi:hypothetical protein